MRILSIETSCDETAVSIVDAVGVFPEATYSVLGNALLSQIDIHREYGGVFPNLAKREHARTLVPMLTQALTEAKLLTEAPRSLSQQEVEELHELLHREHGMADEMITFLETYENPKIDAIAVTSGPGLEPTLWVGINFAKALARTWNIPIVPVNHMEGHVLASVFTGYNLHTVALPALALLISGGHTELVLMKDWWTYELVGQTRDDAVGEAFDKVARLLGLPYPGGPEISKLAEDARTRELPQFADLPRPMLSSGDHDFSFSGLKTAVRYAIQEKELSNDERAALARDFEDAATEVLLAKTAAAFETTGAQSLILGGGVTANRHIRSSFTEHFATEYPDAAVYLPESGLSTDNSIMIALAGHAHIDNALDPLSASSLINADGNRSITAK